MFETDSGEIVKLTDQQIRDARITGIETNKPTPAVRTADDHPDVEIVAGRRAWLGVFEIAE